MFLGFSCILFQLASLVQTLPASVPEPAVAIAASPARDSAPVAAADLPSPVPVSPRALLADAEPNRNSSSLRNVSSSASSAQNSQALSTLRVPPVEPGRTVRAARTIPSRKSWVMLSLAQHGAATFDAYATRRAVSSGAIERNPLMRPFAGSPSIYAAIQVAPMGLDYIAIRMQRSPHGFLRHTWWLPQAASTGLFIFCGAHNLHLAH